MRGWREEGREEGMGRDGGVLRGLWEKNRSEASEEEESPSIRPSVCVRHRLFLGFPVILLHDGDPACCSTSGS